MIRKDVLLGLASARLKVRYRGAWTGLLWVLFHSVTLYAAQLAVFHNLLSVEFKTYAVYLASGFFPWFFIQQSVLMGTGTFISYAHLMRSLTVHPMSYLVAVIADTAVSFFLSFFVVLTVLHLYAGAISGLQFLLLAISCIPLMLASFFLVWMCATAQVFLRDTAFVMNFLLYVLFITSPILYKPSSLPKSFSLWLLCNPVSILLHPFHVAIEDTEITSFLLALSAACCLVLLLAIPTIVLWRRVNHALIARL